MRPPCEKLWHGLGKDLLLELFDDQIINRDKIRGVKSEFGEEQIDPVHPERTFVSQLGEIRLAKGGSIPDDEGTLAFMNILNGPESAHALAPPGVEIGSRQFRKASKRIVGITRNIPKRGGKDLFEGLLHGLFRA